MIKVARQISKDLMAKILSLIFPKMNNTNKEISKITFNWDYLYYTQDLKPCNIYRERER